MHFAPKPLPLLAALALFALPIAGCGDDEETSSAVEAVSTAETPSTTTAVTSETGTSPETESTVSDPDKTVKETGSEGGAETPKVAITAFLTSSDSDLVCNDLIGPALMKTTYGDVSGCLNGRPPESLAKSADIGEVTLGDGVATATAVPQGGSYSGADVDFELTLGGGGWVIEMVKADVPVGP